MGRRWCNAISCSELSGATSRAELVMVVPGSEERRIIGPFAPPLPVFPFNPCLPTTTSRILRRRRRNEGVSHCESLLRES